MLAGGLVANASAATFTVDTQSELNTALSSVQPGDSIVISGTINSGGTTLKTVRDGTSAAPITIRGTNNALIKSTAGYGLEILHDYYRLSDFRIEGTAGSVAGSPGKGLVITGAKHGIVDNVHVRYTDDEAFKIRFGSQYWLFTSCSARNTGLKKVQDDGKQGPYGEGFYVGNAAKKETNGSYTITDSTTRYVTFFECYTIDTASDGWDVKEGSRFVKIINCTADFSGSVEPAANALFGDNGFFLRGNDIQVVKSSVKGLGNGKAGYSFANIVASNVDYGSSGNQLKQSAIVSGSGPLVRSESGTNASVFTDCVLGSAATLYASDSSGSSGITRPAPSTFSERTWSGIGGSAYANLNPAIGTGDPLLGGSTLMSAVFDTGTSGNPPGGWMVTAPAGTSATVQPFPSSSDRSLQFSDTVAGASAEAVRSFTAQSGQVSLEFEFYVSSNWFRFQLRNGTTVAVELYTKDGQLVYRNPAGTDVAIAPYATNTWTPVKIVANASTDTFDIFVNGASEGTALPFRSTTTSLNTVVFGSGGSTIGTHYIDNVFVRN